MVRGAGFARGVILACAAGVCLGAAAFADDPGGDSGVAEGRDVEAFTGGHTRVVWVADDTNADTFAHSADLRLMGYDSRDGRGARVILEGPANFTVPLLTPDGERVVFSNQWDNSVSVVHFDGTGQRRLAEGIVTDLWEEPGTGRVWVYAQKNSRENEGPIYRFPLDDPSIEEIVWSSSPVQVVPVGGFQVSRDGMRASGLFPWPNAGLADLPDVAWRKLRDGCWPSIAPDNSHMQWIFDGAHKNLLMARPGGEKQWKIPLASAPGIDGSKVYHPRWTNHARYMVMTGPYSLGKPGGDLNKGGPQVEIHIGKFNESFDAIEEWLQLTDRPHAAFFPDVWIEGGREALSAFHRDDHRRKEKEGFDFFALFRKKPALSDSWPVSDKGLVYLWENNRSANTFTNARGKKRSARLTAVGGARWGPNGEMHIVNGGFLPDDFFADEIRAACMDTDRLAIEAIVTTARNPQSGPARIVSFSGGTAKRNFTLGQQDNMLVLRLQTSESNRNGVDFNLAPLEPGVPHHVIVTYEPGLLVCYIDGKVGAESRLEAGTFEDWRDYELFFGKERGGVRYWEGFLENIAIYNRFIPAEEAALKFRAAQGILGARKPVQTIRVRAEMLVREDPPSPESIAPYRRALAINRYRVVEAGDPALEHADVQVAEWVLLDGQEPPAYASAMPGIVRELELQPFNAHPQLESEFMAGDSFSLDGEVYYDVSSGR
jgi:hypothetical protein